MATLSKLQALQEEIANQQKACEFLLQSTTFTPLSDVKQIFGSQYIGPDQTASVFENEVFEPNGVLMNPLALEAFAKAGHYLIFMPALSVQEIVQKTASLKQKDGIVMYYPDQFNQQGEQIKPWWKNVEGFNSSSFILSQRTTKAQFLLIHPTEIAGTPNNKVSAQLKLQKEYHLDILGHLIPTELKLASNSLTPEVLFFLSRLEENDQKAETGIVLSLPFVETFWFNLAEDMYSYAALSTCGDKTITRHRMYNRVKTASPYDDFLMFGYSISGANVASFGADAGDFGIGLFSSCRVGVV